MRQPILILSAVAALAFTTGCPTSNTTDGGGGGTGGSVGGGSGGGVGGGSGGGSGGGVGGGSGGGVGGGSGGGVGGGSGGGVGGGTGGGTASNGPVLLKPSRSSSIAITSGNTDGGIAPDALVVAVNPDNDSLSIFNTSNNLKTNSVSFSGGNQVPVSVAIAPDNTTAYVVLRKAQKLVKVTGIDSATPQIAGTVSVGSEPTGVALSPTGKYAVVANFGEDFVSLVDTSAMTAQSITVGPNPRAVTITNNLDNNDSDETALITLFYGMVNTASAEGNDDSRIGRVVPLSLSSMTPGAPILLQPIADTGFAVGAGTNVGCSPNQLNNIAIDGTKAYVTHVCASPKGPVNPLTNVFAAVSVIDLSTMQEDVSVKGTYALSKLLKAQEATANTSNLLGLPVEIDFKLGAPSVAYVASQAGDSVQRIQYSGGTRNGVTLDVMLGNTQAFQQIDLHGTSIKAPIGIVTANSSANQKAYVNNWIDRSVSVIDLGSNPQTVTTVISSEAKPTAGTPEAQVLQGKGFYFTGTGRWATRSVNSCGSCHPDGLSDGITWIFAAGPRQTIPMDGTFSKAAGILDQRALNWTAIFDEIHDFEGNTRGTAGGKGAIVDATDTPINLAVALSPDGGSAPGAQDFLAGSTRQTVLFLSSNQAWEAINAFSKTIVPNRKPTALTAADITAGQTLFSNGACANCHGGPKWTVSNVSYTPSPDKNGTRALPTGCGTGGGSACTPTGLRTLAFDGGTINSLDKLEVGAEVGVTLEDGGVGNVAPERIACVIRYVGTFALATERKADGTMAQGQHGFNPPSLFGLATSAPYFHAGAAGSLDDLLDATKYGQHLTAGNPNFTLNATEEAQLKAFLLSIDDTTTAPAIPAGQDICAGY